MNSLSMRQKDMRPAPAEIEYKGFKFLITDRPSDQNIHIYIQVMLLISYILKKRSNDIILFF